MYLSWPYELIVMLWPRASRAAPPSRTPVSVTQNLSDLRLTYARLLEENGSTVAQLRRREAELATLEGELEAEQQTVERLRHELDVVKDRASRFEQRAGLAERDTGFLKAMVVRSSYPFAFFILSGPPGELYRRGGFPGCHEG